MMPFMQVAELAAWLFLSTAVTRLGTDDVVAFLNNH
jgi:hypothetical protein